MFKLQTSNAPHTAVPLVGPEANISDSVLGGLRSNMIASFCARFMHHIRSVILRASVIVGIFPSLDHSLTGSPGWDSGKHLVGNRQVS